MAQIKTLPAGPGDVLAVWTGGGIVADAIRFAEDLTRFRRHQQHHATANHVVIVTHKDEAGRWIGIEGRPGGVGVCDCSRYLVDPRTRTNHDQPRDPGALPAFLAGCAADLGLRYDWVGIAEDAAAALGIQPDPFIDKLYRFGDTPLGPVAGAATPMTPLSGGVVCSSEAAMRYHKAGWAYPVAGSDRTTTPDDWWLWNDLAGWKTPLYA